MTSMHLVTDSQMKYQSYIYLLSDGNLECVINNNLEAVREAKTYC